MGRHLQGADAETRRRRRLLQGVLLHLQQFDRLPLPCGQRLDGPVEGLHVVFIGRAVRQPERLIERLRGRPVLIVMEGVASLDAGAMLSLVPVGGRIRFEASPMLAERAGLKLGARLLALAERVVTR